MGSSIGLENWFCITVFETGDAGRLLKQFSDAFACFQSWCVSGFA